MCDNATHRQSLLIKTERPVVYNICTLQTTVLATGTYEQHEQLVSASEMCQTLLTHSLVVERRISPNQFTHSIRVSHVTDSTEIVIRVKCGSPCRQKCLALTVTHTVFKSRL